MRKPDFFIVGAPKCGTTAMTQYLRQHPDIYMPRKKELHFFGSDLESAWFTRDEDAYLGWFTAVAAEKRVGEASVWYLYSQKAAVEIHAFAPHAQIIIMLRNPVDMLYSQHSQFLYNGNEDIPDFMAALAAEPDRKQGRRIPPQAHLVEGLFYRETARYTEQVKRYFDTFGRENVHIIIFDDFKADTAQVYRETLRFLGVDDTFFPELTVVNPGKTVRSRRMENVLRNLPLPVLRLSRLVPASLRRSLFAGLKRANMRVQPRPPLNPADRRRLQDEFAPEIEALSALLGRDLTHWSRA